MIKLTREDCHTTSLLGIYQNIARGLGYGPRKVKQLEFNCTKLSVSRGLAEEFKSAATEAEWDKQEINTVLLLFGPKITIDSDDCIAEVEDGFVIEPKRERLVKAAHA